MHRTTIMLPDGLKFEAQADAHKRGISLAEYIRGALEQAVAKSKAGSSTDPLFADRKVFRGDSPHDLASHHDDYLYGDSGQ